MNTELETLRKVLVAVADPADWRITKACIERIDITDSASLSARLAEDPPVAGWIVGQSGHHLIVDGRLPEGRWLEGEWLARSGASFQLRDVTGGWVLVRVQEGEGEAFLVCTKRHLPSRGAPGALVWQVFHRADGVQCAPVFAAFRGFDPIRQA